MALDRSPTLALAAPPPPGWRPAVAARRAALRALADGHLSDPGGVEQAALESAVAHLLGLAPGRVRAFASGSAAVLAALLAAGAGPGRRVLVSALAPAYVAGIVELAGATPVAVDVEALDLGPDPALIAARVDRATAAVLWTPGLGAGASPAALTASLGAQAPPVVEDAAPLLGERDRAGLAIGARAFAGAFSLGFGKALGAGEGGLLTMPDAAAAERVRELGGAASLPRLGPLGRLARLTSVVAAASLPELSERRARRRALAARLSAVADRAGVASFATAGLPLWAGRFATAAAARRAERRAAALRLELAAPLAFAAGRRDLPVARDSAERVRLMPWWDAGAARTAEADILVGAFARALAVEA